MGLLGVCQDNEGHLSALVLEAVPYSFFEALHGTPVLDAEEEAQGCVGVALALEFLVARGIFLTSLDIRDVALTATREVKLACLGEALAPKKRNEPSVCLAYAGLLACAGHASARVQKRFAPVVRAFQDGTIHTLCELVLAVQEVSDELVTRVWAKCFRLSRHIFPTMGRPREARRDGSLAGLG